jgi:hypothetical protein
METQSEEYCYFVSSRGIAKSCKQHPIFNDHNQVILNISFDVSYGDSIYIPFGYLITFLIQGLPHFKHPINLVVGNDDNTFPNDFSLEILQLIENSDKILKFFCQNCTFHTNKILPIPIGFDYHSLSYLSSYNPNPLTSLEQEEQLLAISKTFRPLKECSIKCVTNFQYSLDMPRRSNFRLPALNILNNKPFMIWLPKQSRNEFWNSLDQNAFVICPPGNGLDTHRLWETLALGRIPITNDTGLHVYSDLPILQVKDWNIITEEWLSDKLQEIIQNLENNVYNMNKLSLKYWSDLINN